MKRLEPRTKRKRNTVQVDELAQDDSWDSDKIGYAREQYNPPRPSRRRSGIDEDEQPAQADGAAGTTREKRQEPDQDRNPVQEDSWDSDKIGAHRESYRPRPSRRKSRAVFDAEDEDLAAPERSLPDTCPPGPRVSEGMRNAQPILISSGQQAPQEQSNAIEGIEGIDPGYLAALPEELRQEVIADQQARKSQASRTRGRGRPSEGGSNGVPRIEETPQPKKRGRKKKETAKEDGLTVAGEADTQATAATTTPATKKKRGRPKKSETNQPPPAPAADDDISFAYEVEDVSNVADETGLTEAQSQVTEIAPAPTRAPSKRGRKKKVVEETIAPPEEEESSIHGAEEAINSEYQEATIKSKAHSKRGRKRKVVEEPPSADESDGGRVEGSQHDLEAGSDAEEHPQAAAKRQRKALTDVSNTASSQGPVEGIDEKDKAIPRSVDDMEREATPEAKTKEIPKSASSATNQQGKVPLRVGLSKRSRIAPLLKIIRK